MPRGHHTPLPWTVVEQVEELADMRSAHLEDGHVCPREEERERAHIHLVLLPAAVNSADAAAIAQTIARYGAECDSARRMLKRRAERLADIVAMVEEDPVPDDGAAALRTA